MQCKSNLNSADCGTEFDLCCSHAIQAAQVEESEPSHTEFANEVDLQRMPFSLKERGRRASIHTHRRGGDWVWESILQLHLASKSTNAGSSMQRLDCKLLALQKVQRSQCTITFGGT